MKKNQEYSDLLARIMLETGVRDNFVIRSLEYFEKSYEIIKDFLPSEHPDLLLIQKNIEKVNIPVESKEEIKEANISIGNILTDLARIKANIPEEVEILDEIEVQENVVVNRPQSATLNNNQYNYSNQNAGRKVDNANTTARVNYNTPISVNQLKSQPSAITAEEDFIETSDRQNISIGAGGVVDPSILPKNPYKEPIGDAIPFIVMLAGVYAFILRRKQ